MLRPLTRICPDVGGSSRKSSFRKVDLPAPDGPVRKTNSPRSIEHVTSERACRNRPYSLETRKSWIMGKCDVRCAICDVPWKSARQSFLQGGADQGRVRPAARLLHDLADEPAERLGLAGAIELSLRRVRCDDLRRHGVESARVADPTEALLRHDRGGLRG